MNHDETIAVVGILVDRLGGDVRITYEEIARARHELTVAPDPLRDDVRLTVDHVTQRGELLAGEIVDDPVAPEAIEPTRIIGEGEEIGAPPPYRLSYIESVDGRRHGYLNDRGLVAWTRDANHPFDRRCPECRS